MRERRRAWEAMAIIPKSARVTRAVMAGVMTAIPEAARINPATAVKIVRQVLEHAQVTLATIAEATSLREVETPASSAAG